MKSQLTQDFSFQASFYTHLTNSKFPLTFVLQGKRGWNLTEHNKAWLHISHCKGKTGVPNFQVRLFLFQLVLIKDRLSLRASRKLTSLITLVQVFLSLILF